MSFNSCTINACPVDALCGDRRTATVHRLLQEKYPSTQMKRGGVGRAAWPTRPRLEEEQHQLPPTEHSVVTVLLTMDGVEHRTSQARTNEHALVLIGNFEITEHQAIHVNISGLTMTNHAAN